MAPPSAENIASPPTSTQSSIFSTPVGTLEEQLSSILSSSQFTVSNYLNVALEDVSDDDLQPRMAELALQLQLQTQACHEDIGRIGAELQAILPRCTADVGRVGVGLEGLRIDAASLLESTSVESEEDVSSSLETLSTLHALQANLTRTKEILTAAATWDSTLSSIAPLLSQHNLTEAVNALAQLENGERALRGMPNPQEREEAIAKVRQQVSVLLQPQLKHALANMNTRLAPLQQCVSLYSKLNKMDSLKQEYVKNRPAAIHKAWFDYTPSYGEEEEREQAFLNWLPGWFDSVLSLITEERRQAMTVFGPELVPEIIIKVFRECFRPILGSFQSRLESIYSPNPVGSTKGSLETVCAIYESTLQFLSLSYESIAGGWIDIQESGMVQGNGVGLYKEMVSIFLQVALPFKPYQEQLAALESKYSNNKIQSATRDIRQAVSGVSGERPSLESLQVAMDRLQELSTFVFPLAEGAVARFELLSGGYNAAESLSAIDRFMSGYAGELAIAIQSLSAAMTADEKKLADSFDDSHVLCALEVLKTAGTFRRQMRTLEEKTRERLGVLSERMAAQSVREKDFDEAASKTRASSSTGPVLLPDSVSVVEIDSILTKAVCGASDDDDAVGSYALLQRLAIDDNTRSQLYPGTEESAKRLANSCHRFVFDVCFSVPRFHLTGMSSMSAWKEEAGSDSIASYGTLPQTYITQVGEHMLALVQALEPFATDSNALALANEVMSDIRAVAKQPWSDFVSASGSMDADGVVDSLMDGKEIASYVVSTALVDDEEDETEEGSEVDKENAAFCNAWLDVVGLAVTGRLLEQIMRIPSLTTKGCEHLNADLNYFVNVLTALGVTGHPHPLLGHIAELAIVEGDLLAERISNRDRSNPVESTMRSAEERLAAMRGIAASYKY